MKLFVLSLALISSSAVANGTEYTLYRTGIDIPTQKHDETLRVHVATFDAVPLANVDDNTKYNLANCVFSQELFSTNQPHHRGTIYSNIKIRYWCEKGHFRK